jgi:hypothetical protein
VFFFLRHHGPCAFHSLVTLLSTLHTLCLHIRLANIVAIINTFWFILNDKRMWTPQIMCHNVMPYGNVLDLWKHVLLGCNRWHIPESSTLTWDQVGNVHRKQKDQMYSRNHAILWDIHQGKSLLPLV